MRNESILLVDDEEGILNMLERVLKQEGYNRIHTAMTGAEALRQVQNGSIDLIVLDVTLPDTDGFELCRQIRRYTTIPILFVTARSGELDKLMGLGIGGDDYITKPFSALEIAARINAQLRRHIQYRTSESTSEEVMRYGPMIIDKGTGLLKHNGKQVQCTAKEFELLVFLCERPNKVFTAHQLYEQVWNAFMPGDEKTVVIHISKLRKKIEQNPADPKIIVNLRGIGYKFVPPVGSDSE
ncbi:response regulator transcription factor [Paenibacillus elgii]|uniref:response regulator transcription factor n=1 Tax=Paenibacillus elgii TaxID=189691 RepID=UPI000FD94E82|nr:response regulator transcription factor [Paenibacillus elgii]NEN83556.1 response regulator transcription factor [Paenibacillus elgii]